MLQASPDTESAQKVAHAAHTLERMLHQNTNNEFNMDFKVS